jgi:two-component system, NarL family, nitrate/nitrite response regulator NarL
MATTGPVSSQLQRTTVVVADDHPLYRRGLADTITARPELQLLAEAEDGREALAAVREHEPDVVVLDLQMPGLDGLQVVRALQQEDLAARPLILSASYGSEMVYEALGAGASGFLSKDSGGGAICDAITAIARGETVLGPDVQGALAQEVRRRAPAGPPLLTEREHEILRLTAEGLSAPAIGERLHLGQTTVKTHLQRVYEKLGVSDRAAAVATAMRKGMLD